MNPNLNPNPLISLCPNQILLWTFTLSCLCWVHWHIVIEKWCIRNIFFIQFQNTTIQYLINIFLQLNNTYFNLFSMCVIIDLCTQFLLDLKRILSDYLCLSYILSHPKFTVLYLWLIISNNVILKFTRLWFFSMRYPSVWH